MPDEKVKTRIAPTPSGFLHIGNLYSFVLTWLKAKSCGGTLLLRIDDLDAERVRPEFLEDIFRVLDFIGLVPDEGPSGMDDFLANYSQFTRLARYQTVLDQLSSAGYVYGCSCSRKQILSVNPEGVYPETCRNLKLGLENDDLAWRLALPSGLWVEYFDHGKNMTTKVHLNKEMGDFVVRRKWGLPAYQVASLVDDDFFRINMVVRGEDLALSTAAQIQLAGMLKMESFGRVHWHHHPLVSNDRGEKLSKSEGDMAVKTMIEKGASKSVMLSLIASMIFGKEYHVTSLNQMLSFYNLHSY